MKFIDPANSCCGRYEGGENPYSLAAALWGGLKLTFYENVDFGKLNLMK